MSSPEVNVIHLLATFDASTNTLGYSQSTIEAPQGLSQIQVELVTQNGTGARFDDFPVIWLDSQTLLPIPLPHGFHVDRASDTLVLIRDMNLVNVQTTYRFYMVVGHGGALYYSDPSIANQPPG